MLGLIKNLYVCYLKTKIVEKMILTKDEIVRDEILSQAQKLFQQFDLKKTTMDEIAAACGKAKSTLYHYFKSKEEVFDAVIKIEMQRLRIIVKDEVAEAKSVKDKLMVYFVKFHREVLNKAIIYRIVRHEASSGSLAKDTFNKLIEFETSYITRILEDGYDSGEFTEFKKKDIPWFAEILIAGFFGIVHYSVDRDEFLDQKRLEMAVNLLIHP